jgi:hypothetical protein
LHRWRRLRPISPLEGIGWSKLNRAESPRTVWAAGSLGRVCGAASSILQLRASAHSAGGDRRCTGGAACGPFPHSRGLAGRNRIAQNPRGLCALLALWGGCAVLLPASRSCAQPPTVLGEIGVAPVAPPAAHAPTQKPWIDCWCVRTSVYACLLLQLIGVPFAGAASPCTADRAAYSDLHVPDSYWSSDCRLASVHRIRFRRCVPPTTCTRRAHATHTRIRGDTAQRR